MRFQPTEPFVPAPGLGSAHAQTLYAYLFRPLRRPPLRRERLELPDGDFVDLDTFDGASGAPHVLALHGLESSSRAGYVVSILRGAAERGWGATALNFRSCSGEPNRMARFYHSGETEDALAVIHHLRARASGPLYVTGFSLGANVLLRLLERTGEAAPLDGAAAVSTPFNLDACARALDGPGLFPWLYRTFFLLSLKPKAREKLRRFPQSLDAQALKRARTLRAFDDTVTAPLHGFQDAAHYYAASSSGPHLHAIRRPTLLVSASDDPMIPPPPVPPQAADNPCLSVLTTDKGGHVGFVAGRADAPRFWAEEQVLHFFDHLLAGTRPPTPSRGPRATTPPP